MPPQRRRLRHQPAASGARLRRVLRRHRPHHPTGTFRLVGQYDPELVPSLVQNSSVQLLLQPSWTFEVRLVLRRPGHVPDAKVFDADATETLGDDPRHLVTVV